MHEDVTFFCSIKHKFNKFREIRRQFNVHKYNLIFIKFILLKLIYFLQI